MRAPPQPRPISRRRAASCRKPYPMKTTVQQRRALAKSIFACAFLLLTILIVISFVGCASPVIPGRVEAAEIAWNGSSQNAGVLAQTKEYVLLTPRKKAEYDALVAIYARGTADYPITPPVDPKAGVKRLLGRDVGFPEHPWVWRLDAEAVSWFMTFREWQLSGRKPR